MYISWGEKQAIKFNHCVIWETVFLALTVKYILFVFELLENVWKMRHWRVFMVYSEAGNP
jgi:hypothetical protein